MRRIITTILILPFLLFPLSILAVNTYSIDLEKGSTQSLSHVDAAAFDIIGDISIEAWVKLEEAPSDSGGYFAIASKFLSTGSQRSYLYAIKDSDDKLFFGAYEQGDGSVLTDSYGSTALTAEEGWIHTAVTFDASTKTTIFYVNGVAETTTYITRTADVILNGAANFEIGTTLHEVTYFFDGLIDDVRLWNDVRTQPEIDDNKSLELVGNEANLAGYWKLNNDPTDETTSSNDLTENNSPVYSVDVPFAAPAAVPEEQIPSIIMMF